MPILFLPFFFFLYQTIAVGLMDAIEFKYVNPTVFYIHNFPDILGIPHNKRDQQGAYAAFVSGVKCCPPLVIPALLKAGILAYKENINHTALWKLHAGLAALLWVGDIAVLATYDTSQHDSFRNHRWFYRLHIGVEVVSFLSCILAS